MGPPSPSQAAAARRDGGERPSAPTLLAEPRPERRGDRWDLVADEEAAWGDLDRESERRLARLLRGKA